MNNSTTLNCTFIFSGASYLMFHLFNTIRNCEQCAMGGVIITAAALTVAYLFICYQLALCIIAARKTAETKDDAPAVLDSNLF